MMTVFGGATGTGITSPQGVFDAFLQAGWVSVVEVWKNIGWSPKVVLAALMAAILFAIGSVCVCIGFIVYLASHIMLGLAVIVGPLFVVFVLLPQTASLFGSWLTTLLSLVLTQTMISILLAVLRDTSQQILNQIVAISGTASGTAGEYTNDLGAQIHLYDEMVLLYFIIGSLSASMPVLAGTLAGLRLPVWPRLPAPSKGLSGRPQTRSRLRLREPTRRSRPRRRVTARQACVRSRR
jgi:type IV secretory pathway VirB6-like protein